MVVYCGTGSYFVIIQIPKTKMFKPRFQRASGMTKMALLTFAVGRAMIRFKEKNEASYLDPKDGSICLCLFPQLL